MNQYFWKNKKVLVTGHTGFKGSWLSVCLHEMGAQVIGYSLDPVNRKDNFVLSNLSDRIIDIRGDIRDANTIQQVFDKYKPQIVFHLAAQPLVRLSYDKPFETYETNVMGTLNVLEAIRMTDSVKAGVMITTDKCYQNKEQIWGYRETDNFGGYDPYSSSKACAEILINSYRSSYFNIRDYETHGKLIASVRAGNVIGGGDWAKDRIIPDCIRAIEQNEIIGIRNPKAIRPWQHVLEPLSGYIMLAEKLYAGEKDFAEGWNFGPEYGSFATVWEVADRLVKEYGKGELVDISEEKCLHEANLLFLDITKAKYKLGWRPKLNLEETIRLTVEWYKNYTENNVYDLCIKQINKFFDIYN